MELQKFLKWALIESTDTDFSFAYLKFNLERFSLSGISYDFA